MGLYFNGAGEVMKRFKNKRIAVFSIALALCGVLCLVPVTAKASLESSISVFTVEVNIDGPDIVNVNNVSNFEAVISPQQGEGGAYSWTVLSGEAIVILTDDNQKISGVQPSTPGNFVLQVKYTKDGIDVFAQKQIIAYDLEIHGEKILPAEHPQNSNKTQSVSHYQGD